MRAPLWAWAVLIIACVAMSSGGLWFALQSGVPPILKACWRLTATCVMQFLPFCWQWYNADAALRSRVIASTAVLIGAGIVLAAHFAAWSVSVACTSLVHALLFISMTPLVLVLWAIARCCCYRSVRPLCGNTPAKLSRSLDGASSVDARCGDAGGSAPVFAAPGGRASVDCAPPLSAAAASVQALQQPAPVSPQPPPCVVDPPTTAPLPPTLLECAGTALGMVCAVLLAVAASTSTDAAPTGVPESVAGDLFALLGAALLAVYLYAGSRLRLFMPLFIYSFPVTFVSAVAAGAAALALEQSPAGALAPVTIGGVGPSSLFGWLAGGERFWLTVGSAATAGIVGHTGANLAIMYISPLAVSVAMLLEPVAGSLLGYAVGYQPAPSPLTVVYGLVLIGSAAVVTLGDRAYPYDAQLRAALADGAARLGLQRSGGSAPLAQAAAGGGEMSTAALYDAPTEMPQR